MDPMDLSRATTPDHGTPNDEMNRSRTEAVEPYLAFDNMMANFE